MKRCRHPQEYRLDRAIFGIGLDVQTTMRWWWTDGERTAECVANRCSYCGEWLPLGPARDDGEHAAAVAVEVRAAELADRLRRIKRFPVLYSSLRFDGAEIAGHITYISDSAKQPEQDGEWAGYLAAAIATHTEDQ